MTSPLPAPALTDGQSVHRPGTPTLCAAAVALSLGWAALGFWVPIVGVTVRGRSMEHAYHDGDRVFVYRGTNITPGRIVVVERPAISMERQESAARWDCPALSGTAGTRAVSTRQWMIKRVAAVSGDPVPRTTVPALAEAEEERVPPGKVVLLGDNRAFSLDSGQVGYFPANRLLGTVFWPRDR
ncbi:S26 family signal peptidase [Streptomyces chrestomyceticus]|uniref:S26 family signal peptidase n=1 Tax=Streptomyces chrestomyceticus TaxID=68185 RepID=UPI0035A9903B